MTSPGTAPAEVGAYELIAWIARRRRRFVVQGRSMWPTLSDGDEVLVAPHRAVAAGDVVVARHPFKVDVFMVKRVDHFDAGGRAFLVGDNPAESSDSSVLGGLDPELIQGPVTSRF